MTTAVVFTIASAFVLILAGILSILNITSNIFGTSEDEWEFSKTFKRHGLLMILSLVSGAATIGGIIWIIVLKLSELA